MSKPKLERAGDLAELERKRAAGWHKIADEADWSGNYTTADMARAAARRATDAALTLETVDPEQLIPNW